MKNKRTEIFGEESHAKGVDAESDNFRNDHVYVPARRSSEFARSEKEKKN
jgi:hypothetical protein